MEDEVVVAIIFTASQVGGFWLLCFKLVVQRYSTMKVGQLFDIGAIYIREHYY